MDPGDAFLPDSDLDEITRLLGHALFQAQYLEYALSALYGVSAVLEGAASPREEMNKRFRQTLGVLVRDVGTIGVRGGFADELRTALHRRNEVVHRFYKHYAPFVQSRAIFEQARAHLMVAFKTLEAAAIRVELETERRIVRLGKSADEMRQGAAEAAAAYRAALEAGDAPEDNWD